MENGGVTLRELKDELDRQSDKIIAKMNRVEDRLSNDISVVKADCEGDVEKLERKVGELEHQSKTDDRIATIVSSVVGAVTAVVGVFLSTR
jgi:polyhydroxyalkanoate synthesis regulator phasin